MRVFRITGLYQLYLEKFYRRHPGLAEESCADQAGALAYDAFGWADFWEHALTPHGVELRSGIANAAALQRAWARETSGADSVKRDLKVILADQVERFRPEVLFVEDFSAVSRAWVEQVRAQCPSIRAVVGWCGAPYGTVDVFRSFDLVLSNIPDLVAHFREQGLDATLFRHAFDPRILDRLQRNQPKRFDFSFVGQIALGRREHHERLRILKAISRRHRIDIFSSLGDRTRLRQQAKQLVGMLWYQSLDGLMRAGVPRSVLNSIPFVRRPFYWGGVPRVDLSHRFTLRKLHPSVYGLEMFQVLHDSRITFNSHIDIAGDSASNMRLFEATGAGACLVTDWKSDLAQIFEPDAEVVTYRSVDECISKVDWLLRHPAEAARIGAAGQRRTLRDHTFAARAPLLVELLERTVRGQGIM